MPKLKLQLAGFLPFRLSVLTNTVSSAIAAGYAQRFGISIPEWRVIAVLAESSGLAAAEVAQRTVMDKVAVSRAASALLRRRLLRRQVSRHDRRRSELTLSAAGLAVYDQIVPMALGYEKALLTAITVTERRQLNAVLRKLQVRAMQLVSS